MFSKLSKTDDYLAASKSFELKTIQRDQRDKKIAFIIAGAGVLFGLLALIGIITLLPLKETKVDLYVADKLSGYIEKVTTVEDGKESENLALAKYFIANYVEKREGYNWFRLQHDYDAVQVYGTGDVNKAYLDWYGGANAPDKIYGATLTVEPRIITNFVTESSNIDNPDLLATLRWEKRIRDVKSGNVVSQFWTTRLTYRFEPSQKMSTEQRQLNPLGFTVTSYQSEQEQGAS